MSKRYANFGGVGAQPSPYAPGRSPSFKGGPSGSGIDTFNGDTSLDAIMCRTHNPNILGFERSMASIIEAFHEDLEKDAVPYLLDFDERIKLHTKKQIRDKEEFLKEKRNQNNVLIPKDRDEKIAKKLKTVEEMLEYFRKNTNKDFTKNAQADSYVRRNPSLPLNDEYLATDEEYNDDGNPLNLTKNRLTWAPTGNTPQYRPEDGIDKYQEEISDPTLPWMHENFEGLINTGTIGYAENVSSKTENEAIEDGKSKITPESLNNNLTMEQKIEKMKPPSSGTGRLDPSMTKTIDWDAKLQGDPEERFVTQEKLYGNDGYGGSSTTDYPENSNNPYFSVLK
jgi:hypothetical protein